MNAITQFVFTFLFSFLLFEDATANEVGMHEFNKMGFARALEDTQPCYSEASMLVGCLLTESGTPDQGWLDCSDCYTDAGNGNEDATCNSMENTMCVDLQECADAKCPEACHDEFHAGVACGLREAGCTGNECSASFKAKAIAISFAASMSVLGWMFV